MENTMTIDDYTAAITIDGAADYFLMESDALGAYRKINRNTIMGVTGNPADISSVQTFTNKVIGITNTITALDTLFTLQDNSDNTKQLQFQLSGITTATTRTLTVPNANTTIVGTDATQTLTNKTLTSPTITGGTITGSTISVDAIAENTPANGVTVDGLNIKDGKLNTNNSVVTANITDAAVTPDKMNFGAQAAFEANAGTTTSTSYTATLSGTPGTNPSVTVTVPASGQVLVSLSTGLQNSTTGQTASMGVALSGANTVAATDNFAVRNQTAVGAATFLQMGVTRMLTGLTPGSTTFTLQYKASANTASYSIRSLVVIPIGD